MTRSEEPLTPRARNRARARTPEMRNEESGMSAAGESARGGFGHERGSGVSKEREEAL